MSVDVTMAVLYAQTGLAAPMVNAAAAAPQAAAALSRVIATEIARQEQQKVEKSEKTDKPAVSADGRNRQNLSFGSRRKKRLQFVDTHREQEEVRPPLSPLVGNLLNVRI
ncbi:MAG: hypothetical protein LBB60_03845 [Desulfovibrio sp.]|jgi:hypothetical protein|nr:hypothetical protein [Desulfovibrio sp.]